MPAYFDEFCQDVLATGQDRYGLSLGIVSRIADERYHVVAVRDKRGVFKAGEHFPLKNTYCREVIESGKPLAIPMSGDERVLKAHPLYARMPLAVYIAAPVYREGKLWGTINFSDIKAGRTFTPDDILFIQELAYGLTTYLDNFLPLKQERTG